MVLCVLNFGRISKLLLDNSRYSQIYNITCPGTCTIGEVAGQILKKELKRLSFVRRRYLKNSERKMAKISELELDSITEFHKALVDAFTHALKSAEARLAI